MVIIYVAGTAVILCLCVYIVKLKEKIKKLRNSFKELLQESRRQTPKSRRNTENVYLHLNQNFMIEYMNDTACRFFDTNPEAIANQPALGRIVEDTPANLAYLNSCFHRLQKNPETINGEIIITPAHAPKLKMKIRIRPILNEVLDCTGMSIVLTDISEAEKLRSKLENIQNRDILNNSLLNEKALFQKLEKEFNRCKRYNEDFSLIVLEMKDIYDFTCKGIDFETGDRLIEEAGKICAGAKRPAGRFDKTKFAILMPQEARENAVEVVQNMYYPLIKMIQRAGIDRDNAEMFVISYTDRKNFNETTDTLLSRINRHISTALNKREYGIISSDRKQSSMS